MRAFRQAAAAVDEVDRRELGLLASSGGLKRLASVGDTTARVIAEAVAGKVAELPRGAGGVDAAALSPERWRSGQR